MKLNDLTTGKEVLSMSDVHEDLYMRNMPAIEFDELMKQMSGIGAVIDGGGDDANADSKAQEMIVNVFENVLCDKSGDKLEDIAAMDGVTYAKVAAIVPASTMWQIISTIPKCIIPREQALGN